MKPHSAHLDRTPAPPPANPIRFAPRINRRQMFRGLTLGAGGLFLSPVLRDIRAMAGETPRSLARPMRFVFFLEGNGFNPEQAVPASIPRPKDAHNQNARTEYFESPLTGHALPRALEPLEKYKDRLTILHGLSGRICGGGHSNNFGALGAYPGKGQLALAETVDAALAKKIPGIFPVVGLGISDRAEHTTIYNVSAWGPGKKLPTQCRPDLAWNALFGSVAAGDARAQHIAERNVLDFVAEDARRIEARLDGSERDKLSAYIGAFETMRERQTRLDGIAASLRKNAPERTDKFTSIVETDRLEAQVELAAASLIAGMTNICTLASGCGDPYFSVRFHGLGVALDKHSIGHGKGLDTRTASDLSTHIRRYHIGLVARLADRLAAVPEGTGTMLDNTCIIYMSDSAESHHSRCWEWPMLVLGDLGGRLKTRGRFICYPSHAKPGHRTISNFYTTLLNAAGDPRNFFGQPDPALKDFDPRGPLTEILA